MFFYRICSTNVHKKTRVQERKRKKRKRDGSVSTIGGFGCLSDEDYRARYQECIRMLNGMERTLERQLPESDRRWPNSSLREEAENHGSGLCGFPEP
jgi:hypothetical protein